MAAPSTIRLFASHDWGRDNATHHRVASVVRELAGRGFKVWFDETNMKGNILDAMCRGIEAADVVLVFITKNYMNKVASGRGTDNVRREFMFAAHHPERLLPIRFDPDLPATWTGPLRMILGSSLYVDLSAPTLTAKHYDELAEAIRRRTPRVMWKSAAQFARRARPVATRTTRFASSAPPAEAPTVRGRLHRALEVVGDRLQPGERVGGAVNRLVLTLLGTKALDDDKPLVERLALIERQLGI